MTREEAVALLERYSNYEGLGIPNLAGCKEAMKVNPSPRAKQINLDNHGGCGYVPDVKWKQLTLFGKR